MCFTKCFNRVIDGEDNTRMTVTLKAVDAYCFQTDKQTSTQSCKKRERVKEYKKAKEQKSKKRNREKERKNILVRNNAMPSTERMRHNISTFHKNYLGTRSKPKKRSS